MINFIYDVINIKISGPETFKKSSTFLNKDKRQKYYTSKGMYFSFHIFFFIRKIF